MKKFVFFGVLILAFLNNSALATRIVLDNVPLFQIRPGRSIPSRPIAVVGVFLFTNLEHK